MMVPSAAHENLKWIDPRPVPGGEATTNVDTPPADGFFDKTDFKGAFGTDLWLADWSISADYKLLPDNIMPDEILKGAITVDKLRKGQDVLHDRAGVCQERCHPHHRGRYHHQVVQDWCFGCRAGSCHRAGRQDHGCGHRLQAHHLHFGSARVPTSCVRAWGGVIVLGKATIAGGPTDSIEGLPTGDGTYGGSDDADNSGACSTSDWYGGSVIGQNNEINGLTLGGVGSGTTLDHIEIAHNLDDGIEFFGGAANVKYLSVLFCGDDGIDSTRLARQDPVRRGCRREEWTSRTRDGFQNWR